MTDDLGLRVEARVLRERSVEVDAICRLFFRGEISKQEVADRLQRIRSEETEKVLRVEAAEFSEVVDFERGEHELSEHERGYPV